MALSSERRHLPIKTAFKKRAAGNVGFGPGPFSIWNPSESPVTVDSGDGASVELGVKFQASVAGNVTGVRFYKSLANTGVHVGNLWTTGGVNLATVNFAGESASGWQQQLFGAPVAILANTTYIISYFAPVGRYSADNFYFSSSGHVNGPLRALANSESVNGIFKYNPVSIFPDQTFNATNYWVDLVFTI